MIKYNLADEDSTIEKQLFSNTKSLAFSYLGYLISPNKCSRSYAKQ